jgi:hypothetical protein
MKKTGKPRKLLVYLDQNVLSEMAKLSFNPRVRPDFAELFQLLHRAFRENKLVAPGSIFHDAETSISGSLKEPIRQCQAMLSHVHLEHHAHIKERQIARAIHLWLGRDDASSVINFDDAFESDPDEPVSMFDIGINSDWMFRNEAQKRLGLAQRLDVVGRRERADATSFDALYKRELDWVRKDIAACHNALWIGATAETSVDEVRAFAASDLFGEIPIIHLEVALLARLMTNNSDHHIKPGDATDFDAMAAYLPYCDAFVTDRLTANAARSIDVHTHYGCALFDASRQGISDLMEFLKQRLALSPTEAK